MSNVNLSALSWKLRAKGGPAAPRTSRGLWNAFASKRLERTETTRERHPHAITERAQLQGSHDELLELACTAPGLLLITARVLAPAWWRGAPSRGVDMGHQLAMADIDPPVTAGGIFAEPRALGPVGADLWNLRALADISRRYRAASVRRDEWTADGALARIVRAVLAANVPVYVWDTELPRALDAERPRVDPDEFGPAVVYQSERERHLWDALPSPMNPGAAMAVAGRLGLSAEDAVSVLGLPGQLLGLVPAGSNGRDEDKAEMVAAAVAPVATHVRGDMASMRRAVALVRELEGGRKRVEGLRIDVARQFGVNERTLSKWIAKVEAADAEDARHAAGIAVFANFTSKRR